jgi:hypothetical protein
LSKGSRVESFFQHPFLLIFVNYFLKNLKNMLGGQGGRDFAFWLEKCKFAKKLVKFWKTWPNFRSQQKD